MYLTVLAAVNEGMELKPNDRECWYKNTSLGQKYVEKKSEF